MSSCIYELVFLITDNAYSAKRLNLKLVKSKQSSDVTSPSSPIPLFKKISSKTKEGRLPGPDADGGRRTIGRSQ